MKFSGLWLLCFALQDGSLTTTRAMLVFKKPAGTGLSLIWISRKNISMKMLCKDECGEENVLVWTSGSRQKNGRYSITHKKKGSPPEDQIIVTISNLTLSDSGSYRYNWSGSVQSGYTDFIIEVVEAEKNMVITRSATPGEDVSLPCAFSASGSQKTFCKNECSTEDILVNTRLAEGQNGRYRIQYTQVSKDLIVMKVTITNVSSSDSGLYQCQLDQRVFEFWIEVGQVVVPFNGNRQPAPSKDEPVSSAPQHFTFILVTFLSCVILIIITAAILTFCNKRVWRTTRSNGGPNMESNYVNISQSPNERVYQSLCLQNMDPPYSSLHRENTQRNVST